MNNSYRVTILVVVLATSTVTPQGLFDKQGSPPDNDGSVKSSKDAGGAFSKVFWGKITNPDPVLSPVFSNTSTKSALYSVVLSRFTKEMESLFVTLPMAIQCRELLKVSKKSSCSSVTLYNATSFRMNVSKCSWHENDKQQAKTCNRTAVAKVFEHQMGQVFESLPWPFKCNIVNLVAQTYRVRNRGQTGKYQPRISVKDTEDAIEKIFSFINIGEACSKAKQDIDLPQVPPVCLKVQLNNGTTKESWVRSFKTKGPQLYYLYLTYQQKSVNGRPLIDSSIRKTLPTDVPCKIYVTEVSDGMPQFSVVFGLKIKKNGNEYREMKSTYKIMRSLRKANAEDKLNAIIHAKVLQVELKKEEVAISIPEHTSTTWTAQEMNSALSLFPKNMTDYYKRVGHIERCFIMFWISSSLGRNPAEMEQFLNALDLVIRRHSCYYTKRDGTGNITVPKVDREKLMPTMLPQTTHPRSKEKDAGSSERSTQSTDQDKEPVKQDTDNESEVSSLEYALFILLSLLCVATLAFTINYALFALKRSPNRTNGHLPREVCQQNVKSLSYKSQDVKSKREQCVHVIHKDQNMAKQGQLPYSSTGSSFCTRESGKPHTNHPTKALAQNSNPGITGSDSGYSKSPEGSNPCHTSVIKRDLHSETQLCNQTCSHAKSLEPRNERSSEAKTSEMNTSPNPDASVDLECRPNSVASSDSSNILSPSRKTERCQERGSTGDSESSCTQSYKTVSSEDPFEKLHVMFDHGGIKEVQV